MSFTEPTSQTSKFTPVPITVGRYKSGDRRLFLPISAEEIDRSREAMQRVIASFGFEMGRTVVLCSLLDEVAQMLPFERALMNANLVVCSVDGSLNDASRFESAMRRFHPAAAAGLSTSMLDGLIGKGQDPVKLLQGHVVWAYPDAYQRLQAAGDIVLRRWINLGPAVALECSEGDGAHLDRVEWYAEEDNGEILLSSRLGRSMHFDRIRTGIYGHIEHIPCACGNADPRIILA